MCLSSYLCGIFKVRVRTTRTVNTNVASEVDVGTAMRFAHDSDHSNTTDDNNVR